ncbi:hypothetical protein WJX81_006318 [Elliptochloris bilobata]|uniref:Uncharacterized protein n=1 Tax=Elliptochloris bilobata TaxID=381761 RepID=A0AAW1S7S2_9CHLO
MPKVALLFLARGAMPLEPAWREFLEAAALTEPVSLQRYTAMLPVDASNEMVPTELVDAGRGAAATAAVAAGEGAPGSVVDRQRLFSVYIHPPPGYSYSPGSVFAGLEVPNRVTVMWAQYSVVEAERRLLQAALLDPLNQRFVLLSEACLPIYPPHLLWAQLMAEDKARVNACATPTPEDAERRYVKRWERGMHTERMSKTHWRKSAQWFALARPLAQVIAADDHVAPVFERECFTYAPDGKVPAPPHLQALLDAGFRMQKRACVADEHYVPTLLAVHGLDNQTDCLGVMTHADWAWPSWSPKTYQTFEVTLPLIARLRAKKWYTPEPDAACDPGPSLASADAVFRRPGDARNLAVRRPSKRAGTHREFVPLGPACSLFARKFDGKSIDAVLWAAMDCEEGFAWHRICM